MICEKSKTLALLEQNGLEAFAKIYLAALSEQKKRADYQRFDNTLANLPEATPELVELTKPIVKIGEPHEITLAAKSELESNLKQLMPWRKGPFELFGVHIDAEWRSDWKWARLENEISSLEGRKILDVGCGNGYYMLRMLGAGANFTLGVEPYLLSVAQFYSIKKYLPDAPAQIIPARFERLLKAKFFDTVFSMGVLYHNREPLQHLAKLRDFAREGGEVVLETLIIKGKKGDVLVPSGRYAKMRNVWALPSALTLEDWLKDVGFKNVRLINVTPTTTEEQRKTEWMTYESLEDFLDKNDKSITVEGYPAPIRAMFIAESP